MPFDAGRKVGRYMVVRRFERSIRSLLQSSTRFFEFFRKTGHLFEVESEL